MSERTYTEAEVRAAIKKSQWGGIDVEHDIIAELNRQAIHPDVWLEYKYRGDRHVVRASSTFDAEATNIRPLVPTEAVQKWWDVWLSDGPHGPFGQWLTDRISHYITTGEV